MGKEETAALCWSSCRAAVPTLPLALASSLQGPYPLAQPRAGLFTCPHPPQDSSTYMTPKGVLQVPFSAFRSQKSHLPVPESQRSREQI